MIEVNNLSRRYGDVVAVEDVSFHIGRGEIVGLLGRNGAGKSTIMKMLTGYLEPTGGEITVGGLCMGRDTLGIQRRIGYLPENCPVWPEMSVVEYLYFQAALHGVPESGRAAAVARAIRRTELQAKAYAPIQALSRGYRQRVGVAQAILHTPDILILDEPTNGLDPTQIRHMRRLIGELAEHATVIVSTHILQEVQAVCDRVLILRAGRLALDASLSELQSGQRLLITLDNPDAAYLARINGVHGVHRRDEVQGRFRYVLEADPEMAPNIAAEIHGHGDRLFALHPEARDLESVFAEVSEHGGAVGPEAPAS